MNKVLFTSMIALAMIEGGCVAQKTDEPQTDEKITFLVMDEYLSAESKTSDCKSVWVMDEDENVYEVTISKDGSIFMVSINEELIFSNHDVTAEEKKELLPLLKRAYELTDTIQSTEQLLQKTKENKPLSRLRVSHSQKRSFSQMRYESRIMRAQKEILELIDKSMKILDVEVIEEPELQQKETQPLKISKPKGLNPLLSQQRQYS